MAKKKVRPVRHDKNGKLLCHAQRRDGNYCTQAAMLGQRVCRMHGGSSPVSLAAARKRLLEEVDPSIGLLIRERDKEENASKDRQSAANSILDRAGLGRTSQVEVGDARQMLLDRLVAAAAEELL